MTKANDPKEPTDPAVALTLCYLQSLERHLKIVFNSQGEPVCVHDEVSASDIALLKTELRDLMNGEAGTKAIEASKKFGHNHIQSIGFGHADSLDALGKLGLLCGERVVLWDILSCRTLVLSERSNFSVDGIAAIACNLLLLRQVVQSGGLVVLPHPLTWSSLAQRADRELLQQGNRSSRSLGLSFAVCAVEEGIPLHPYTLFRMGEEVPELGAENGRILSDKNASYQAAVSSLLSDKDFSFLTDIPAAAFFEITRRYPDFHRALRKHFLSLSGMTIQQRTQESLALVQELKAVIGKRDKAVLDYAIDGSIATAGLVAGSFMLATSIAGATVMAGLGLAPTAMSVIRRWLKRPDQMVIVQAFSELQASKTPALELFTAIPTVTLIEPDADLAEHIDNLTAMYWTEDKNKYLSELDEETARRVADSLLPEQIQILVNNRTFQEDYIGDYLEYLWDVSELAFWRHIEETFQSKDGMLLYDGLNVHNVLIQYDMPISVWISLLTSIPRVYAAPLLQGLPLKYKQEAGKALADIQIERLLEVLAFQLASSKGLYSKRRAFHFWLSCASAEELSTADQISARLFSDGLPDWLVEMNEARALDVSTNLKVSNG